MKIYKDLKYLGILAALLGLFYTFIDHSSFGPIMMAFGIIFATLAIFKDKKQNIISFIIMATALGIMLILEYFIVPIQNTNFYILLLIMSIATFLTFYFSLKPQNIPTKGEKILAWTGSILFVISLSGLMGIIYNNFSLSLILGASLLIMSAIFTLIRKRIFKDNALKDEFTEPHPTRDPEEYWFRYEIGSTPKPVSWQGWACYVIMFLSPFVILILSRDPLTTTVIAVAIILIIMIIAIIKSNYRESVRENKENLKKETD